MDGEVDPDVLAAAANGVNMVTVITCGIIILAKLTACLGNSTSLADG